MNAPTTTLDDVRTRFEQLGYLVSNRCFFAPTGLYVRSQPVDTKIGPVSEHAVFIYPHEHSWELRVTPHGGPHWTHPAGSLEEMEVIACEVLNATSIWKPSGRWQREPGEWPSETRRRR